MSFLPGPIRYIRSRTHSIWAQIKARAFEPRLNPDQAFQVSSPRSFPFPFPHPRIIFFKKEFSPCWGKRRFFPPVVRLIQSFFPWYRKSCFNRRSSCNSLLLSYFKLAWAWSPGLRNAVMSCSLTIKSEVSLKPFNCFLCNTLHWHFIWVQWKHFEFTKRQGFEAFLSYKRDSTSPYYKVWAWNLSFV